METAPKYVFYGFVVAVLGGLGAMALYTRPGRPPAPPLQGAGSTFVHPLMVQWDNAYEQKGEGCKVDYYPGGSGYGIDKMIAGKVHFACTDAPLTDDQMAKARQAGGEVVHVPLVLGAVAAVYNLPEISEPLRFTGSLLADIYLGKIKRWNEPPIKSLNPHLADQLPNREIIVVHRSEGSGTTYIWTDYLSKVSEEWKKKAGYGVEISWPAGVAAAGNEGVSEQVKNTPGAIAYVELTYAFRNDLPFGLIRNKAGQFVKAGTTSINAAAANGLTNLPEDLRYSLTDSPGKGSYPICGTTWAVVRLNQVWEKGMRREQLTDFLHWTTEEGQKYADLLLYVPLPDALRQRARAQIARIKVEG
jgi:phosphate transport system substrate-binding protein